MARTVIPFGPQHPVLPEPIHLDLVLEDEKVVEAVPSIGFVHRGLEKLVEKKDFKSYAYVVERVCGICSFMHGMSYCEAIEHIMNIEVPRRGRYLRTIWCEMSRIHSHLLWLGLLADAFGFESLFMESWKMRERILDMFEQSTGGRVIFSVNTPGGVLKDMDNDMLKEFDIKFSELEKDLHKITDTFLEDSTVKSRLKGTGILTKKQVIELGAVGPVMRASGIAIDNRKLGYAAYDEIDFDIITSEDCDGYARCAVRIGELYQSIKIIHMAIGKIPEGEICTPVKGMPNGSYIMRVEQPRGEAVYYVKANGTQYLDRCRVRTPTFANIPALLEMLKGCELADVPLQVLTIDPCISCTER